MDAQTLAKAMPGLTLDRARQEIDEANQALQRAKCSTVKRAAMFLAQVGHESMSLRYTEEIASGAAYEGRSDLGNTQAGDGRRFKGRSYIQVTGRHNYRLLSRWAYQRGYVPKQDYFINNPDQLASAKYRWLGPVWYWDLRNMNSYGDRGDIRGATRAVNGGYNGLTDRTQRWNRCRGLGTAIKPTKKKEATPLANKQKARSIRKGDLVRVTTRSGLRARKTPRGAQAYRNGKPLIRPYDFRVRVARSIWYKAGGGQRWVQGTGGIWYCARQSGNQYMRRIVPGQKKKKAKPTTPVPGYRMTTPWRKKPNNRTYWQTRGYHTGADFAAPQGAKVVAVRPGTVHRYKDRVLGNVCLLYANNGQTYWYCHLRSFWGRNGRKVKAGQMIGKVGATGTGANGPHLHLEKRAGHTTSWAGKDLNPLNW